MEYDVYLHYKCVPGRHVISRIYWNTSVKRSKVASLNRRTKNNVKDLAMQLRGLKCGVCCLEVKI